MRGRAARINLTTKCLHLRLSHVFSFRKPSVDALRRILAIESTLDLTYDAVGATFGQVPMPEGFVVDHTRVELGRGEAVFERAKRALSSWRQFHLGWLEAFPTDTPIRVGETVLVLARVGGMWWANAARILYAVDESTAAAARFGFAYGTLPAHVERGEERFLIELDRTSDVVSFDILAFSRPKHYLVRMNSRRARTMQKRFAAESTAAMKRYVAEEERER